MKRRKFITTAAIGGISAAALASSLPKPAIAQSQPEIKWRLASSFPKSLDTLFGGCEFIAKRVAASTNNKFQIQTFAGGEIVPAFGVVDAIQQNTVECAHTASYYFVGKNKTFAFDTTIPFGLNQRQQNAWIYYGGGLDLVREFFRDFGFISFPAGNTGVQMGGWWRTEVKTVADLKGKKMRIAGLGGEVMARLGAVPQQIAGGDIYPALERGAIDAAEWIGPYDDEKLGFYKIAPYYYYPGWWEGGTANHFMMNLAKWEELPKHYQAIITAATGFTNIQQTGRYDARNPAALKRVVAGGAKLRPFSQAIMEACLKASQEVNAETSAANPDYKKVWDSIQAFRNDEYFWWQVAEYGYDNFMIRTVMKT